ncbi:hypothetical protein BSL78_19109 [Apostichopus japonicus]|uniref:Uncharacterized protein n=1 Tax=Stichopus japonicus TaxID=307972 RepID=A0A2G8K7P4_STIJA|nr:hypothetical protein BSL78_19109 [Apostichopus japonicus]
MTGMFTTITEKEREKVVHPSDSLEPPESMAQQEECFVNQSLPEDTQSSGGSLQHGSPSKDFQMDGSPQTSFFDQGGINSDSHETLQDPQMCSPIAGGFLQDLSSPEDPQSSGGSRQNGSPAKRFQMDPGLPQISFFGNERILTTLVKLLPAVPDWVYQKTSGKVGNILPDWLAFWKTFSAISCKFPMMKVLIFVIFSSVLGTVSGQTCLDCIDLVDPTDCCDKTQVCSGSRCLNLSSGNRSSLPFNLSVTYPNIEELHLANNNFVQIPDGAIGGFTKLYSLNMDGNNISSFNESYDSLQTLTKLSLIQNSITKLPDYFNRRLPNLKAAYFGNNKITEVPYLDLDLNHSNLGILGLENNPLVKLNLQQFNRPDTVRAITANNNETLVYVNGSSSPIKIIIQGSNLTCENNNQEFHQSIDVNGTISCNYRNGSKGEISLLHVTNTDPVVTTSVPTTPSIPTQNNSNVAVIVPVVLVVLVIIVCLIRYLLKKAACREPGSRELNELNDSQMPQMVAYNDLAQ